MKTRLIASFFLALFVSMFIVGCGNGYKRGERLPEEIKRQMGFYDK